MIFQLREFWMTNDVVVHFVHGQVFLLLGVAMGLQFFQRSRLELARALPWLAAFGVLEAVATWGNSFIPLQRTVMSADVIRNLQFLQLLVHLLSYAALLGFGLRLNEPRLPAWTAPTVSLVVVLVLTSLISINRVVAEGVDAIPNATVEAVLRYILCLPAALLVAFGLRQQAARLIGPLKAPRMVNVLRVAGIGFVVYAFFEGVIVPASGFFPANVLNETVVFNTIGIPIGIWRSLVGAVIAWYMFRSLEAFKIEADRLADALQNQQALNTERERISRDLHDGTLQNIFAAGLMIDDARHALSAADHPENVVHARSQLTNVISALDKTATEIRGYIYDLRRSVAGDEDLSRGMLDIITEFRLRTTVPTDWVVDGCAQFDSTPEFRHHMYQIAREALSNISRHSSATHAQVELRYEDCEGDNARSVRLRISDNGRGALDSARAGRGLLNMRERAALLQGNFSIRSEQGKGTVVELHVSRT
jgi:signal transduction histidine kinase